jgi:IclR family transcriptional regulator, pca regulon regulatory protein
VSSTERESNESAATEGGRGDFVQSLERGLSVLTAFSAEHPQMTLSDVARQAGLTRATARRLLLTLEALHYVSSDGRLFELTPKVLDLGYAYVSSFRIPDIAQPYMERLSEQLDESVSCAVLDGNDIVYVARVPTRRIMTVSISLGTRLPAVVTSMGRSILAAMARHELDAFLTTTNFVRYTDSTVTDVDALRRELDDVRRQGWALLDQELEDGVRSVACGLKDRRGRVDAAINISAHAGRVTLKDMRSTFVPALLDTAAQITKQLAKR